MSDEIERIHGWPVNAPIPMRGGGVAYVVCKLTGELPFVLSGYVIGAGGSVCPKAWTAQGTYCQSDSHRYDLDPSYRVLPESELPLWTIEDSDALLGKAIRQKERRSASFVHEVHDDGHLTVGGIRRNYRYLADTYTHLDGTPIPQRRMP